MGIERVAADGVGSGKSVSQRKAVRGGRCAAEGCHLVGLLVHERRLIHHRLARHGVGKGGVLAHGVVHAEAGPHHGLPGQAQRQAQPRRKGGAEGINQRGRERPAIGAAATGLNLGRLGKPAAWVGVDKGQVTVFFRVGREILVAQAVVQRELGQHPPVVLGVDIHHVVAQVALARGRVDAGFFRLAQQKIRQRGAGVKAGEVERAGRIRAAQKIAMHPAVVAPETQVVLGVNPAQSLRK